MLSFFQKSLEAKFQNVSKHTWLPIRFLKHNMDSFETGEICNQTIFDYYDSYLLEYKQLVGYHLDKYRQDFIDYLHQNARHLAITVIIYVIFCFCFYFFIMRTKLVQQIGAISKCSSILFVVSHPDDECMFFGPTIVTFSNQPGTSVYLLCLSTGNFNQLGRIRKEELFESCKILGIPEANVQVINCTSLPDNPKVNWNQEIVAEIILNFIEIYSIETVITFDKHGVSNHPNHVSVFYAMAHLCLEKKLPKKCTVFALESVSTIRKYTAYLDIPLTYLLSSKKYVVPMEKRNLIRQAMRAHQSQYVWFRKLYMFFSRYVFINSYREINVLELEMDFVEDGSG